MQVEIWSDVMCPFCYIGKRNYEKALEEFDNRDDIEVIWKSFQLDPSISNDGPDKLDTYEYLSRRKGISRDQVARMHEQVTKMAEKAGLEYHLDKTIMSNSFDAHRLIQRAKDKGLGDEAEELLFYINFTQGKDFGDRSILKETGLKIGLNEMEIVEAFRDEKYAMKVDEDIQEAKEIGVNGVPFFVFDRKYAVSGAQPPASFLQVLEKSYGEWKSTSD